MSYCKTEGKDKIIFATEEDHKTKSSVTLTDSEEPPGLILPDGGINWSCPCLGGMATGPCGVQFREAFSCFHYSKAEPKGSDCYDAFKVMQECMNQYPTIYNAGAEDDAEDDNEFGTESLDRETKKMDKFEGKDISDVEKESSSKNSSDVSNDTVKSK